MFFYLDNSKTFNPDRLLLNLSDKINLREKRKAKYVALSNLSIYYTDFFLLLKYE